VSGGIARILVLLHSPNIADAYKAPFSHFLGQTNAVAFSMIVFGLVVWKIGQTIVDKKWHETTLGLWCISLGSLMACMLLPYVR
jgi:hypothetical protein